MLLNVVFQIKFLHKAQLRLAHKRNLLTVRFRGCFKKFSDLSYVLYSVAQQTDIKCLDSDILLLRCRPAAVGHCCLLLFLWCLLFEMTFRCP